VKRRRWADPPSRYLEEQTQVRVRFQEVDGLRIVWHGHYLTYFEEGRLAFGRRFGLEYRDVLEQGYVIPLVHAECDYYAPARHGDVLTVVARLHPEAAARLTFSFEVRAEDQRLLAAGITVQAFTDPDGALVLTRPAFYEAFLERWADQVVEP